MSLKKNGVLLMMTGNLFFGFLPILVKWGNTQGYSSTQTTFFRFAFATLGILALAGAGVQPLKPVNTKALIWRGFCGGSSVFLYFFTLQWTTAGKATLFNYTYTIWANVFAVIFLKRKAPRGLGFLLALAGLGVFLVLGSKFESLNWGDLTGIFSGIVAGAAVAATREARRTDNALTVFGSFTFFGFLISGLFLLFGPSGGFNHWTPLTTGGWEILLAMGACAMGAQLLFTQGYGYTSLAMGTLLSLTVPVLAALFGLLFLNEPLTPHFILGTTMVLAACGILSRLDSKPHYQ